MKQEDIQKALEALGKNGITVAGDLVLEKKVEYEVNNVESGGIGIQIINGKGETSLTVSDNEIKTALEQLQEAKDEQNKYIMHDSDQWYAVFRVLSYYCGYPSKPKDFERVMKNIGTDDLRLPCVYENFRKVPLGQLPNNVSLWSNYANIANQQTQKQLKVAMKLMEILDVK